MQDKQETSVNVPQTSSGEGTLSDLGLNYGAQYSYPSAEKLSSAATTGLSRTVNPDYSSMYSGMQSGITTQQNNFNDLQSYANQGYKDLASGKTSEALQNARYDYINEPMQKATKAQGDSLNSLASRGVLNSRVTSDSLANIGNDATNNIANRLSDAYTTDYNLSANTLNSEISNKSNLINQGMQTAYAPIQYGAQAQQDSYSTPLQTYNAATGQASVGSDMWNQMANRRYGASGTTTTGTDNSLMNGVLGIGAAYAGRKVG